MPKRRAGGLRSRRASVREQIHAAPRSPGRRARRRGKPAAKTIALPTSPPTTELGLAFTSLLECGPEWIKDAERAEASYERSLRMFGITERPRRRPQWVPPNLVSLERWREILAPYQEQLHDAHLVDGGNDGRRATTLVAEIARELHLDYWLQREQQGKSRAGRSSLKRVRARRSSVESFIRETIEYWVPGMLEQYLAESQAREPATVDGREMVGQPGFLPWQQRLGSLLAERTDLIIDEIELSGLYVSPPGNGASGPREKRLQNRLLVVLEKIGFTPREIADGLSFWWPRLTKTNVRERLTKLDFARAVAQST